MSCEDNSSSCVRSVAAVGVVDIQCDFILSGLLCIVLKACTSWLVRQRQTRHVASCVQGQLSVLLKCM